MVGCVGAPKGAPGSFVAGKTNSAQFTTIWLVSVVVINLTTKVIAMNTKPSIFSFESSCQIRMFMIDGEPWFVTKDVCNALNIDVTQARKLDKKS